MTRVEGTHAAPPDRLTLAAFVVMVVLAGGNAVGIDILAGELQAFWAAALRFAAAGVIFAILMLALHVPIPRGAALAGAVLYGAVGFGGAFGIAFVAIPMTGAGTGQLLLGLVPLLTLVLAPIHGLERRRLRPVLGALVSVGGVALLTADRIATDVPLIGILLALAAALCLAEAGILVKLIPRADPVATNGIGMLVGAAMLFVLSIGTGETWALPTRTETWAALLYLVVAGSVAVFWLYVFVLGRWTASAVSVEFLLIPVATIPLSAALTGERITTIMLLGGAVILAGVYYGALARHGADARASTAS